MAAGTEAMRLQGAGVRGQGGVSGRARLLPSRGRFARLGRSLALPLVVLLATSALAGPLDEMSVDRWKKLREAERYQLNIAEKFYREHNYKVALAEYEKFLSLHEKSEGAPYAQLKWSLCQVQLRKLNTAIKDGFQAVIDYWPESPEALSSSYLIARTHKDMGEVKSAKKAYANVLAKHGDDIVAVLAKIDLADIARIEGDDKRRVALWTELTFSTDRKNGAEPYCRQASVDLAQWQFGKGSFPEGLKALQTTFNPEQLPHYLTHYSSGSINTLVNTADTKALGEKLADQAVEHVRSQLPADLNDDAAKSRYKQLSFYIADLQWSSKRPEKSKEVYDQLLQKLGNEDDILGRLAGWHKQMNQREEARATYARYKDAFEGQGQIAYSYREEQKYDKAAEIYRNLTTADTRNANRWMGELGHALREGGQYKEAINAYRLWDSFPNNTWHMAGCHRALKEYPTALGLYRQIIVAEPGWAPQSQLQIGYTHEQAGEKENAIKAFQMVCRKYPKSGEASQAHAHLENDYKITATFGGDTGKEE